MINLEQGPIIPTPKSSEEEEKCPSQRGTKAYYFDNSLNGVNSSKKDDLVEVINSLN